MNFLTDIVAQITKNLSAAGVTFDANVAATDPHQFLATHCEFQTRRIVPRIRRVDFSMHIQALQIWPTWRTAVENIKAVSEAGQDLSPYQSKRVGRFEYNDLLLNEWGIQHFHLGNHSVGQNFATRTSELMYAAVESDRIRCLTILDHCGFSDTDLLEILESEWPEYLDRWEVKDVVELGHAPTSAEVKKLRADHIQSVVQLSSGRVFATPGGGSMLAGTSMRAVRAAQWALRVLKNAEHFVKRNEASLRAEIGGPPSAPFRCTELSSSHISITVEGAPGAKVIPVQ